MTIKQCLLSSGTEEAARGRQKRGSCKGYQERSPWLVSRLTNHRVVVRPVIPCWEERRKSWCHQRRSPRFCDQTPRLPERHSALVLLRPALGLSNGEDLTRDEAAATASLPAPEDSGIEHIIVVTMENRSFDHFLGWFPNADTRQHATYPVYNDGVQTTYPLAPDYQGCGHPNPDHSYSGERIDYNAGAMNGWLLNTNNDKYCVGFYRETDIPFLAAVGRNYVTLDHYFSSFLGPTFPNRLFLLAAQTDRLDDSLDLTTLPTIFDRLSAAGVSARYYFNNVPFVGLWGLKYLSISHLHSEFLSDAAAGTLPAVSFVDPRFTILDDDTGTDDDLSELVVPSVQPASQSSWSKLANSDLLNGWRGKIPE